MLLLKHAYVHAPQSLGPCDLLLGGGEILRMEPDLSLPHGWGTVLDACGLLAVPGFIDAHVHFLGGGGEGGFATRTPEFPLGDAVEGGITTLVGCLGTDGVTRTMPALLAKAQSLEEEGLSTYVYSGSYGIPPKTLMGSIEEDLLFLPKVLGVGEVALSDHRSSQPSFASFARVVAEARRGGMLSGKAGLVNVHLGDGPRGLAFLRRILEETELPAHQMLPTHVNRNPKLFEEAITYAQAGGFVDCTTSTAPSSLAEGEVPCSQALRRLLEAGVEPTHLTFTSDGQGSLPEFDGEGRLQRVAVGRVTSLFAAVRDAVQREQVPLSTALQVITSTPARLLKLERKGRLGVGLDADVVLLKPDTLTIHTVIAKGRILMRDGVRLVRGAFEAD